MAQLDLVIRGGTVATAADTVRCDVGVRDGRIVTLAEDLAPDDDEIDARGLYVLPGGIDSHCHLDQQAFDGVEPGRGEFLRCNAPAKAKPAGRFDAGPPA